MLLYDIKLIQRNDGDCEDAMFVDVGPGTMIAFRTTLSTDKFDRM